MDKRFVLPLPSHPRTSLFCILFRNNNTTKHKHTTNLISTKTIGFDTLPLMQVVESTGGVADCDLPSPLH